MCTGTKEFARKGVAGLLAAGENSPSEFSESLTVEEDSSSDSPQPLMEVG
jgi:hypothetical protein